MTPTDDELVFLARMQPYFAAGATLEGAARAVISDDHRIYGTVLGDKEMFWTVQHTIAAAVWHKIRQEG